MENRPLIHDIKKLHSIGRQLSVLKKIYQSYLRIIDRVLDKQYPTSALAQRQSHSADSSSRITLEGSNLGVPLGDAVVVRFERLRDRISLYAIGELEDCLAEKESLVFMVRPSPPPPPSLPPFLTTEPKPRRHSTSSPTKNPPPSSA